MIFRGFSRSGENGNSHEEFLLQYSRNIGKGERKNNQNIQLIYLAQAGR